MPLNWSDKVSMITGVGEKTEELLAKLGIFSVGDLLNWFPHNYLDASHVTLIKDLHNLDIVVLQAEIMEVMQKRSKRGMFYLEARIKDESGEAIARWFGQPYLRQVLAVGTTHYLIGVIRRNLGAWVLNSPIIENEPKIFAIYGQTKGLTSKMLRRYIDLGLKRSESVKEYLPQDALQEYGLISRVDAYHNIHNPVNINQVSIAKRRLAFDELFAFFNKIRIANQDVVEGIVIKAQVDDIKKVVDSLPFTLTDAQKRAVWDALQDMQSGKAMNRLLNGDVGSGKTVVAGILSLMVIKAGLRAVLAVPTEILAFQHAKSLEKVLGIKVGIWTSSRKENQDAGLIVGTHALLYGNLDLGNVALVILDEQHRFGVEQRKGIVGKSAKIPHILSMTATPIPRTLALTLYGTMQTSILNQKPIGRKTVVTKLINDKHRPSMYEHIREEIKAKHKIFIICSLIESKVETEAKEPDEGVNISLVMDEKAEQKAVNQEIVLLNKIFPEAKMAAVHGKLKPAQKQIIMQEFSEGDIDILVATSVVEVGVDVPMATIIVIEGAERFGLAQLHQLRGRVGRNMLQSYCYLCPTGGASWNRLSVLEEESDGFKVAQADLEGRGPGELVGIAQSGLPDFHMASLTDLEFMQFVKEATDKYADNIEVKSIENWLL